jgi:hypothetical protein
MAVPDQEQESRRRELLDRFSAGRLPLLEFMRAVGLLKEECGGFGCSDVLGRAVVASFGRHTEGRDLMACILEIEGFAVSKAERDTPMRDVVDMCRDPDVSVLCLSVQTTYDCPELL